MTPGLSEDQVKESVGKFITLLKSMKGKILHEESWGLKKLKYQIQKKKTGFYYMIEFEAPANILHEFEVD